MDLTATLILAVVAAATGTLAILGVIGFFSILCYRHHQRQQRRRDAERKSAASRSVPATNSPLGTASAITNNHSRELGTDIEAVLDLEDESTATTHYYSKAFPRTRNSHDVESCYDDDNWSFSVGEEGSVLTSQETWMKTKKVLHAGSSSTAPKSVKDSSSVPIPIYNGHDGVMYEV
jgi:predicted deacylase